MQSINYLSDFTELKKAPLLIIDFFATWCGPCKNISPIFENLSMQHATSPYIVFAKCDVDKASDVAQACGIRAMPTFQFYKGGQKVDEIKGADAQQLQTKIGYYAAGIAKETKSAAELSVDVSKPVSLCSLIEEKASRLRGTSNLSSVKNIVSPPPAGYAIASQTGQSQLFIYLQFKAKITVSKLRITAVKDSIQFAPSRIQVGSNMSVITHTAEGATEENDLEIESLSQAENIQAFTIYSDDYIDGVTVLKLKKSKFSGIKSLTMRVDSNQTGEPGTVTKIGRLDFIGTTA